MTSRLSVPFVFPSVRLKGPWRVHLGSLGRLTRAAATVLWRRAWRGPLRPSWTLPFEIGTEFFKAQDAAVDAQAALCGLPACRDLVDSLAFGTPMLRAVAQHEDGSGPVHGRWFTAAAAGPTLLYFHGGGYVFRPAMTDNIVAAVTLAARGRAFVPHYRLAPEAPFPAALEDALDAYRWLLDSGVAPETIVIAGDSAGGHLALSLCLALPREGLPPPAAAVLISPWTDPGGDGESMRVNEPYDWMSPALIRRLAAGANGGSSPRKSSSLALDGDFSVLPKLLVHAGEAEICRDMIAGFCDRAARAGADVRFVAWPDMTHNFHGFGGLVPQAQAALAEIGAFIASVSSAPPPLSPGLATAAPVGSG